jgi:hypothetical protein
MTESLLRINLTREIDWFQEFNPECSAVVLSANVFESFPKAFIRALIKFDKPFVLDPITYVLTDDDADLMEKRWYSKLASLYRLNAVLPPGQRAITLTNLLDNNNNPTAALGLLVSNVMRYQRARIVGSSELQTVREIEEFEGRSVDEARLVPRWIIPPYFQINSSRWSKVNKWCIEEAIRNKQPHEKIFGVLAFDESLLGSNAFEEAILPDYNIPSIDGYLVWISDFRESLQQPQRLKTFMQLVEALSRYGKPIYNMYGSLFSFLIENRGLNGASHSICYGDYKDANAEGGGMIATIRYYYEGLRTKVPYARLDEILRLSGQPRCNCEACNSLLAIQGDSPSDRGEKMRLCAKHFLYVRRREIEQINRGEKNQLLASFRQNYDAFSRADRLGGYQQFYQHLQSWLNALT